METATFDDSMEMTCDTAGHLGPYNDIELHNDIEIELDSTGISGHDEDVVVNDASMTELEHSELTGALREPVTDADMMDGDFQRVGGGYNASGENYQFIDDNLDIDHQTYDMEEDYEEDIDAPIPGASVFQSDVPNTQVSALSATEDSALETSKEDAVELGTQEEASAALKSGTERVQSVELSLDPTTQDGDELNFTTNAPDQPPKNELSQPEQPNDISQIQTEPPITKGPEEVVHEVTRKPSNVDLTKISTDQNSSALHNIQVLYQDSEISLFPPREDDPSETYFLEDESIAHEPIGVLLGACRVVLGDHVDEEEELYIEIECLGLHITEATRTSISLSQIIQIYLDLSKNDGETNPGPLYLSLATQPTFTQNFSAICEAARAGRGLTHISNWKEYENNLAFEEHGATEVTTQEETKKEPHDDIENGPSTPKISSNEVGNGSEEEITQGIAVNEGIKPNAAKTNEDSVVDDTNTVATGVDITPNIKTDISEPENLIHDQAGADEEFEKETTEQNHYLEQAEDQPALGDDQQGSESALPRELSEPAFLVTKHAEQATTTSNVGEEYIEIEFEADKEIHDGESNADGSLALSTHGHDGEPSTPQPTYNPFEADEDIFKSPIAPLVDTAQEQPEAQVEGTSDETTASAKIIDEFDFDNSVSREQEGEAPYGITAATPHVDHHPDLADQVPGLANEEAQSEDHPSSRPDTAIVPEGDDADIFAGSLPQEEWLQGSYEEPDLASLTEPISEETTQELEEEINADFRDDDDGKVAKPAQLDVTFPDDLALQQENSPKTAKRPRADDESNGLTPPKKHRSD